MPPLCPFDWNWEMLTSMGVLFSQLAFPQIIDHGGIGEAIADGFWKLVTPGYQETYLPHLHFGERLAEARHASQANPVRDFPVTLPRLVVGHALTLEQLRRTRIHAGGNGSFVLPGHSVAYRAMLAVDLCPCSQIRLVALDRRVHRHLFSDPCVQGFVGQRFLKGHRGFSRCQLRAG